MTVPRRLHPIALAAAPSVILGALFIFAVGRDQPVRAAASLSKDEALVGESVAYALTVDARLNVAVELPDLDDHLAGFMIRDRKRSVDAASGRRVYRLRYTIARDVAGDYAIGPVTVRYTAAPESAPRELAVRGFALRVKSVIGKGEAAAPARIRISAEGPLAGRGADEAAGPDRFIDAAETPFLYDIKDDVAPRSVATPQEIAFAALFWLAGIIIAAVSATFLYDRLFRKEVPPPSVSRVALDKLAAVKAEAGGGRDAFFATPSILQEYLRTRFGLPAGERTTREFLAELAAAPGVDAAILEKIRGILTRADLVRYAGHPCAVDAAAAEIAAAREIIQATEPPHVV